MRLIFVIIFAAILLTVNCDDDVQDNLILSEQLEKIIEFDNDPVYQPIWELIRSIDMKCIEESVGVTEYGNKIVNSTIFMALILPTFGICSENIYKFADDSLDSIAKSRLSRHADKTDCFKLALQEVEPDATILKGFDSKILNVTAEECERVAVAKKYFDAAISSFEANTSKIEYFTCGLVEKYDIFKIVIKMALISHKQLDAEVEKEAKQDLVHFLVTKAEKFQKCMLKWVSSSETAK